MIDVGADQEVHQGEGGLVVQARLHPRGDAGQQIEEEFPQALHYRLRDAHVQNPGRTGLGLPSKAVYPLLSSEYNYDVVLKGIGYSLIVANVLISWRIYVNKAMVYWPLWTVPVNYYLLAPVYTLNHLVCCRNITRNCSTCAIWGRSSIWEPNGMRYSGNATAYSTARISDQLIVIPLKYTQIGY